VFIAGDDENAKAKVSALVRDGQMRPVDAGRLVRARELEAAALLHMEVQGARDMPFASALKVVP
jgi:8-hydroxy-5-deazaflavin:NADPH oxidoreductase